MEAKAAGSGFSGLVSVFMRSIATGVVGPGFFRPKTGEWLQADFPRGSRPLVSVFWPAKSCRSERLLQAGREVVEGRRQAGADSGDAADDDHGDQRGDQAIFNGGSAVLILAKSQKQIAHNETPFKIPRKIIRRVLPTPYSDR